jgi:hypothetical protein
MPIFTRRPRGRWGGGAARSRAAPPPGARRVERAGRVGVEAEYTGGAELVPEPRALPLGVLPRGHHHAVASLVEAEPTVEALAPRAVAGGVPRRRILGHARGERAHLLEPARVQHGVHAPRDPRGERRAGVDDEVAHGEAGRAGGAGVPGAQPLAGQQRDFGGAQQLRAAERGARRVQHGHPAAQRVERHGAQHDGQPRPPRIVQRRLVPERRGHDAQEQPGAADHQRRGAGGVACPHPVLACVAPPGADHRSVGSATSTP